MIVYRKRDPETGRWLESRRQWLRRIRQWMRYVEMKDDATLDRRQLPGFWQLAREFWMGDLPPAHQRIVTAFWGRALARSVFGFFMVWSLGWATPVGLSSGFARADDTDKKIAAAVDPIVKDLGELRRDQQRTTEQVDFLIRLNLESKIRDLKRQYCSSSPNTPQRRLIDQNMREAQAQYRRVNGGSEYSVPSCDDL